MVNPDAIINQSGRKLIQTLKDFDNLALVNGACHKGRVMDSKFSFYRGSKSSQNDLVLCNNLDSVYSFTIKKKSYLSDYCPCILTIGAKISLPLGIINNCACGFRNYDHYDVSKRIKKMIRLKTLNLCNLNIEMEWLGYTIHDKLLMQPRTIEDIDKLCNEIADGLYQCCVNSKRSIDNVQRTPLQKNCNSENYKAIAEANFSSYLNALNTGNILAEEFYKKEWLFYQDVVWITENEELDRMKTEKWSYYNKKYAKKLWELLDWKGEVRTKSETSPSIISSYFTDIFNSSKTCENPTIDDIKVDITSYYNTLPVTDAQKEMEDLKFALKKLGKRVSFEGISAELLSLLPENLQEGILILFQYIFNTLSERMEKTVAHTHY